MKSSFLLGAIALIFSNTSYGAINVNQVQEVLKQQNPGWVAKKSWVTELSTEQMKRMMGVRELPRVGRLDYESTLEKKGVIDWRSRDGVNWVGPVMNQGNCGSCVAFAAVATLEAQVAISTGLPWIRASFSPQALFACGGGACDYGWYPASAARFLKNTGVADEACLPYTSGSTGVDVACSEKCGDSANREYKIANFKTNGFTSSVDAVKKDLANGPMMTTLTVYEDFMTYGGGVYKHVTGSQLGGHAVSLIGYDDTKRAWLIRNSWGEEWGEKGFAWVSWDDVSGIADQTWGFQVTPEKSYISVIGPSDRTVVSGKALLSSEVGGKVSIDASSDFVIMSETGKKVSIPCNASLRATTCGVEFNSNQLADGRYEIYAVARNGAGVKSQVREFFVLNSTPKLAVSFKPVSGVDLTKPVSGRPEFEVSAQSGPVPMSLVEFRAVDSNGKIAARKSNAYVLPNMKMGWRSITVPDGEYQIYFHGEQQYLGKTYSADSAKVKITVKNKNVTLAQVVP